MKLNEQPLKFPVDANKLLKLGISLGNLIRTLQIDEESYQQQHNQQRQFLQNLNNAKTVVSTVGITVIMEPGFHRQFLTHLEIRQYYNHLHLNISSIQIIVPTPISCHLMYHNHLIKLDLSRIW